MPLPPRRVKRVGDGSLFHLDTRKWQQPVSSYKSVAWKNTESRFEADLRTCDSLTAADEACVNEEIAALVFSMKRVGVIFELSVDIEPENWS